MDIHVFAKPDLPLVVGALRTVAVNPHALSPAETVFLTSLVEIHGGNIALDGCNPISPDQVAVAIASPHRQRRLVQLAIAFAMLPGTLTPQQESTLHKLAQALAVDEPGLMVLHHVCRGRFKLARLLLMRRLMGRFLAAAWQEEGLKGLWQIAGPLALKRGSKNPVLAQRFDQLQHLPTNTLGYAFWHHCTRNGLQFPGHSGSIPLRLVFHDFGHLLSGYGTDPAGEIRQGAFQAGFVRQDGFAFLLFAILQFHWGVQITPVAAAHTGLFEPAPILQALDRGAHCHVDLSDQWNFWPLLDQPLEAVRQQLLNSSPALPQL